MSWLVSGIATLATVCRSVGLDSVDTEAKRRKHVHPRPSRPAPRQRRYQARNTAGRRASAS